MTIYQARMHQRSRLPGAIDPYTKSAAVPAVIPNLRAWYQANLETGYSNGGAVTTFKDWSGNGYNLTGTATYVVDSNLIYIDSNDMYNTSSPAIGNNVFSICIYGDTYNSDGTLFGVGNGGATKYSLNVCENRLYCWGWDPTFTAMGATAPWYLITVTYDQTYVRIYKDNALFTTLTQGSFNIQTGIYMFRWFNDDRQSTLRARFGAVYDKTLTIDEVSQLSEYVHGFAN